MSLSAAEYNVVTNLATPLPRALRSEFVSAVEQALAAYPVRGEGVAHRIARELLPRFFTPPPPYSSAQHHSRRRT